MLVHELICFGSRAGSGNPALVIEDGRPAVAADAVISADAIVDNARQAFAAQRQRVCAFIGPDPAGRAEQLLDFWYPHTQSPLCLHATLAVAHVLFARAPQRTTLCVVTRMQGQLLHISRAGSGRYLISLARQNVNAALPDHALLARLLAWPAMALCAPAAIASVGSPKLLLEVADPATLHALRPDLALLQAWSQANGVNGCYVYCRRGPQTVEGRSFNHLDPAREDRATGVAAGALCAHLGLPLQVWQGAMLGQDCRIDTACEGERILVGGAAELIRVTA